MSAGKKAQRPKKAKEPEDVEFVPAASDVIARGPLVKKRWKALVRAGAKPVTAEIGKRDPSALVFAKRAVDAHRDELRSLGVEIKGDRGFVSLFDVVTADRERLEALGGTHPVARVDLPDKSQLRFPWHKDDLLREILFAAPAAARDLTLQEWLEDRARATADLARQMAFLEAGDTRRAGVASVADVRAVVEDIYGCDTTQLEQEPDNTPVLPPGLGLKPAALTFMEVWLGSVSAQLAGARDLAAEIDDMSRALIAANRPARLANFDPASVSILRAVLFLAAVCLARTKNRNIGWAARTAALPGPMREGLDTYMEQSRRLSETEVGQLVAHLEETAPEGVRLRVATALERTPGEFFRPAPGGGWASGRALPRKSRPSSTPGPPAAGWGWPRPCASSTRRACGAAESTPPSPTSWPPWPPRSCF